MQKNKFIFNNKINYVLRENFLTFVVKNITRIPWKYPIQTKQNRKPPGQQHYIS